jgi:hypothetical protein
MRYRRPLEFTVLIIAVSTGVLAGCDVSKGRAAVEELCKRDGGATISETVNVKGYLNMDPGRDCLICMEQFGRREFEFVDAYLKGPYPSLLFGEPGYHRVSLSQKGDSRCDRYLNAVQAKLLAGPERFGLGPNECFAVDHLAARPQGFVYSVNRRSLMADNGVALGLTERAITQEPLGNVLATHRDYVFVSKWSARFDMSGGGGVIDRTCWHIQGVEWMHSDEFIRRVLHDVNRPRQ